jgi:hypothetical protein
VSLQIVLRALIEVGLKRDNHPALLANVEGQARAVRHQRSVAGRAGLRADVSGSAQTEGRKYGERQPSNVTDERLWNRSASTNTKIFERRVP